MCTKVIRNIENYCISWWGCFNVGACLLSCSSQARLQVAEALLAGTLPRQVFVDFRVDCFKPALSCLQEGRIIWVIFGSLYNPENFTSVAHVSESGLAKRIIGKPWPGSGCVGKPVPRGAPQAPVKGTCPWNCQLQ